MVQKCFVLKLQIETKDTIDWPASIYVQPALLGLVLVS